MIQPQDIRRKAELLYRDFLQAWLAGAGGFFPIEIRGRKSPRSNDLAAASQEVRLLRASSKENVGVGYTIEWQEIRSRTFGLNQFPKRILFESADDFVQFLDRKTEFERFARAATELRGRFPVLEPWIHANPEAIVEIADELDGLLEVLNWFQKHPRPDLFARELPLTVDTKFIENHEHLLRQWFDLILPSHTIRADETDFARRYGLRCAERHLLLRFLDSHLQGLAGFPCDELSLPVHVLSRLDVPIQRVYIVENKVNLLTLPHISGGIALGALGHGVTLLQHLHWLQTLPIQYWGDLDVEGFLILSKLRTLFPQVQSFLMDRETFDRHQRSAVRGTGRLLEVPALLDVAERAVFLHCRDKNLRLEQERIPQSDVLAKMAVHSESEWRQVKA